MVFLAYLGGVVKNKKRRYNLFVHCLLYCLPFYLVFEFAWRLFALFGVHVVVEAAKAGKRKESERDEEEGRQ